MSATRLAPSRRWQFATEISRFLRYCHILAVPVTAPRAREYVALIPLAATRPLTRQALRWYFRSAHTNQGIL